MDKDFKTSVYRVVARIPKGYVSTYADVARAIKRPRAFRAIGNALNANPDLIRVPCHRVVRSDGRVGGYAGGEKMKVKLLANEGVIIKRKRVVDLDSHLFNFR